MLKSKRLTHRATFADMARETTAMAGAIFGIGSKVQIAIANAWVRVGLPVYSLRNPRLPVRPSVRDPKWRNRPLAATKTKTNRKERNA